MSRARARAASAGERSSGAGDKRHYAAMRDDETALRVRPDVAVLDIGLPGIDGLAVAMKLREALPCTHVLILTGLGQQGYLRRALEARVGGYLRKNAPSEEL